MGSQEKEHAAAEGIDELVAAQDYTRARQKLNAVIDLRKKVQFEALVDVFQFASSDARRALGLSTALEVTKQSVRSAFRYLDDVTFLIQ
jgi:hypothetical protein